MGVLRVALAVAAATATAVAAVASAAPGTAEAKTQCCYRIKVEAGGTEETVFSPDGPGGNHPEGDRESYAWGGTTIGLNQYVEGQFDTRFEPFQNRKTSKYAPIYTAYYYSETVTFSDCEKTLASPAGGRVIESRDGVAVVQLNRPAQVQPLIREAFPGTKMFLRVGVYRLGTEHLCGGSEYHGPPSYTEGRQYFFDWYFPPPTRHSLRHSDKVKRFFADYTEEWNLGCPDHMTAIGGPCHQTDGFLTVDVRFNWFPRKDLRDEIDAIRERA